MRAGLKSSQRGMILSMEDSGAGTEESKFLRAMKERMAAEAASLRAEAGLLEAEQRALEAQELVDLFEEFDLNKDGEISQEELRIGLQRLMNESIPEGKVKQLMAEFDDSGDGALQLDEFKGMKAFKSKLDAMVEQEKEAAIQEVYRARQDAKAAKAAEAKAQAVANILNDRKPTATDGLVACLPYFFPLADALPYGRYIFDSMPDSPISQLALVISTIYSSVPFAGLIAFFALASISRNLQLNRLIRFSIQQAIFLDIALIVPGFIGSIGAFLVPDLDPALQAEFSSVFFLSFISLVLYAMVFSLFGKFPNAIPIISAKAEERLPTASQLEKFFDDEGNIVPFDPEAYMKDQEERSRKDRGKDKDDK